MTEISENLEGFKFLTENVDAGRLKGEARNILDSYSHTWDILAEALQNSVDAIDQRYQQVGNDKPRIIKIVFNAQLRSIEISDTGKGMSADEIKRVLAPHQGYKRGGGLRGEKGVGLSFILFLTNRFKLETCNGDRTVSLEVHRANAWVNGTEPEALKFTNFTNTNASLFENSNTFTRIWADEIPTASDQDEDIFTYSLARLIYILRSKTAVGNTYSLFNQGKRPTVDIDVQLKFISSTGETGRFESIPYSYATPASFLKTKEVLSWDDYVQRKVQDKPTNAKGLEKTGNQLTSGGKHVKWYMFISQRTTFDEISQINKLESEDSKDVDAGIFIATRQMPTGIRLPPPRSQQASYWPSFFILLEYDDLRLDMGRKYVGGRVGQMLSKVALMNIFNEYVNAVPKLTMKGQDPFDGLEADELIDRIKVAVKDTPDLDLPAIPYMKEPIEEQGVIAIFHELVGAGLLKGYRTQRSSSYERYDCFVNYKPDLSVIPASRKKQTKENVSYNIFVEFKFEGGKSLLEDFEIRKRPKDFKLLVCWLLNEGIFKENHIEVDEVEPTETAFHGATHRLVFPNSYGFGNENTLHVMALRDLIKSFKEKLRV